MGAIVRHWRIARPGVVTEDAQVRITFFLLLILGFCSLIVAAQVFRAQGARQALSFLKKVGWGYAAGMVVLAVLQAWREWG